MIIPIKADWREYVVSASRFLILGNTAFPTIHPLTHLVDVVFFEIRPQPPELRREQGEHLRPLRLYQQRSV